LLSAVKASQIDRTEYGATALAYCTGQVTEEQLQSAREDLEYWHAQIEQIESDLPIPLQSMLLDEALSAALRAQSLGVAVNEKLFIDTARRIDREHASAMSYANLIRGLLVGAAAQLEQDPRFRKIASGHPKCLDREDAIVYLLAGDSPLADEVAQNELVKEAVERAKQELHDGAPLADTRGWALLRRHDPASARQMAALIKADTAGKLIVDLDRWFYPTSSLVRYKQAMLAKIDGRTDEAKAMISEAERANIPMEVAF